MKPNKYFYFLNLVFILLFHSVVYSQAFKVILPDEGDVYEPLSEIKIIVYSATKLTSAFKINSIKLTQLSNNTTFDIKFDPAKISVKDNLASLKVQIPQNAEENCVLEFDIESVTDKVKSPAFSVHRVIPGDTDYDLSLGTTLSVDNGVKANHFYGALSMFKENIKGILGFSAYLTTGESVGSLTENRHTLTNSTANYNFYNDKTEITNKIVSLGGTVHLKLCEHLSGGVLMEYRNLQTENIGKYKIINSDKTEKDSTNTLNSSNHEHNFGPVLIFRYMTKNITLNVSSALLYTTNSSERLSNMYCTYDLKFLLKETKTGIGIGGDVRKAMFDGNVNPTEFLVYFGKAFSLKNFIDSIIGGK